MSITYTTACDDGRKTEEWQLIRQRGESPSKMPVGRRGGRKGAGPPCRTPMRNRRGHSIGEGRVRPGGWGWENREGTLKICVRRSSPHPDHTGEYPFPNPAGAWNIFNSLDKINQEGLRVGRAVMRL